MHSFFSSVSQSHCPPPSSLSNLSPRPPPPPSLMLPFIFHLPAFVIDRICPCCRLMCLDFSPQSCDNWMSALCPPILVTWTSRGEKNSHTDLTLTRKEVIIGKSIVEKRSLSTVYHLGPRKGKFSFKVLESCTEKYLVHRFFKVW